MLDNRRINIFEIVEEFDVSVETIIHSHLIFNDVKLACGQQRISCFLCGHRNRAPGTLPEGGRSFMDKYKI